MQFYFLCVDISHIFTARVLDIKVEIGNAVFFFFFFFEDISHIFIIRILDI